MASPLSDTNSEVSLPYNYAITHVFFPVQFPEFDDHTLENDLFLARAVLAAAHSHTEHVLEHFLPHWHRTISMLHNLQLSVQSERLEKDHTITLLQGMQEGDILTFFIRPQNAAVIFTRREDNTLCESFAVPPNEDGVDATGSLVYSYPRSAVEICNRVFDDTELQYELAGFLSRPDLFVSDHPSPSPGDPQYITALLFGILRGVGHTVDVPRITKCVRHDVKTHGYRDGIVWRRSPLWLLIRVAIQMSLERSLGRASYKEFMLFFISTLAMDPNHETLSNDLLHLMECKIVRRLTKFGSSTPTWLSEMALKACARLRQILDTRWERPSVSPSFRSPFQDELARDSQVSHMSSDEYIRNALSNPGYQSFGVPFNPNHRRRGTIDDFLSPHGTFFEESYKTDPDIASFDVDRSVEQGIDDWVARVTNVGEACAQLGILLDKYIGALTESHQDRDFGYWPVYDSIKLLTAIELFIAMDKLVIREIPLLADYSPEVPIKFLEGLLLRTTTSLHRLSCAYQYLSARHSSSRSGWSMFSNKFTGDSFPARYYDQSPHLQRVKAQIEGDAMHIAIGLTHQGDDVHSQSPLPVSSLQAKVVVFELQCPAYIRIWRSATFRLLDWFFNEFVRVIEYTPKELEEKEENLLADSPELRPYFSRDDGPPLGLQVHFSYFNPRNSKCRNNPTMRYAFKRHKDHLEILRLPNFVKYGKPEFRLHERKLFNYIGASDTFCASNNVLAGQVHCPTNVPLEEFTALAQLRSYGSLQWLNILHGLRSRTLNLRRHQIHHLLSYAVFQVGPLDLNTGVWIWHQEFENLSFCNALVDELYALFMDFEAESIDATAMGNISLLLTRILASSPHECVAERVIHLLRKIRSRTLSWVEELTYNLAMAPTNAERSRLLLEMAITCRCTFDIDPPCLPKFFRSAEDVDAALSCALFICSLRSGESTYPADDDICFALLLERDQLISLALEAILSDVILADPSEYGIDLAVHKLLGRYQPCTNRWEQLQPPNDRWLSCETEPTLDQPSQALHFNLLTGTLRVDGKHLTGLPLAMRDAPEYKEVFRDQGFIVIPSDMPGMDFMTHTTSSKHKVHYSLQDDDLVVRVQSNGTRDILQLIPPNIFREALPTVLVDDHIHWLNMSSKIIEIRPLERLWEESSGNWRIDCTNNRYRVYKGCETLVDTRSPTWSMVSLCFESLTNLVGLCGESRNLLITTSPTNSLQSPPELQLSVALPHYGLSFFVNSQGELESRDFKDMVYDDDQSIEALFGLDNLLVLRPKLVIAGTFLPEALIPRRVLVPDGFPTRHSGHRVRVELSHWQTHPPMGLFCHVYDVDPELGCLIGNGHLTSTQYLAFLHAATSCDTRPDPLTSKTGAQVAYELLRCGGCQSMMRFRDLSRHSDERFRREPRSKSSDYLEHCYPQVDAANCEIRHRYYWAHYDGVGPKLRNMVQRAAHLFPSRGTGPNPWADHDDVDYSEIDTDLELQDVVSMTASIVYRWCTDVPTISPLVNWEALWHAAGDQEKMFFDTTAPPRSNLGPGAHSDPDLVQKLITKAQNILDTSEETHSRFQLLFLLPTAAYCSPCYPAAFLSMLMAFTNFSALSLRGLSGPAYIGCTFSDGWRPAKRVLGNMLASSVRVSMYTAGELHVATMELLRGWPRNDPPTISLDPHLWDVKRLQASLQPVFSSCFHNFFLIRNLGLGESRLGPIFQVATRPVSESSSRNASHERTRWQVSFEELLADRPVPLLPTCNPLPRDSHWYQSEGHKISAGDILKLKSRIFSSVPTDLSFQQEYLTHLHASSQCTRDEYSVTHAMVAGGARIEAFRSYYVQCNANYMQSLSTLKRALAPPADMLAQALDRSGQWPQVGAIDFLRCLASASPINISPCWKTCLISFALLLLHLQRSRRLFGFALYGLEEDLSKELANLPCDGWSPEEYPDWLLIQIQGNFAIRPAQAETAIELMTPRSGENTVMQVNMGEGKSSVIVPIAAAALADGRQLVRVVVPRALTIQMFDILVSRLGGLANRPIYHLPFSRSPELGYDRHGGSRVVSPQIDDLQKLMSQCMAERGILLLQPEHVVSLRLMNLEEQLREQKLLAEQMPKDQKWIYKHGLSPKSLTGGTVVGDVFRWFTYQPRIRSVDDDSDKLESDCSGLDTASKWFELQKWVLAHCRDILDESDEILHTRFQLIYTIGAQQHMDGYPHRWTIVQRVLQLVKGHAYSLSMYSPGAVEYKGGPQGSFPYIHIVRASDVGRSLASFIAEDVMAGQIPGFNFQHIPPQLHDSIRNFIVHDALKPPDTAEKVEEYAKNSHQSYLWSGLLLLRGLLASDILVFALSEWRWRVNYGLHVNPTHIDARACGPSSRSGGSTALAVPYRAKDTPAPNTQFGHPDIAIILTCLSYYYTGLTEDQLRTSFEILLGEDDPSAEYARWVKDYDDMLPKALQELGEINLRSSEQWDKVTFPLFTRNQATVDFYLSRVVFPKEAKEFPWKLSNSSWDLAEKREKLVTGFSGTNDNRWLLPTSIAQYDLEHQKGTNARILGYLLQPENDCYEVMCDPESSGRQSTREFLEMVVNQKPKIHVLLDVGAQILDLSNQELARAWLDIAQNMSGAVYFDQNSELMVLTQEGTTLPLLSSPLSQTLERCVIYLDHAHTRGTDLRFPNKFRAAVTLGPKVTKDSLVQGCMRMRKLGHAHSVMFFSPPDVDRNIRAVTGKQDATIRVATLDILCWAIHETWTEIQQWAPHWAQQGMSYKSRYEAWARFSYGNLTREELSKACLQPECKSLSELHGPRNTENSSELSALSTLDPGIRQRCEALGVLSLSGAQLGEQQERQVNREREREREVELPPEAEPAEHSIHPDVGTFVKTGIIPPLHSGSAFQPVFTSLRESTAATRDADVWSPFILATTDFCRTVKPESTRGTMDQYLRPVQWVLTRASKSAQDQVLVLLSPFEVHKLLPDIKVSECVHLHLYAPRTSQRMEPSDDLKLYTIPPLPDSWIPPWNLIDQLNVFAGQLYLRDYQSYLRVCRFLGVPTKDSPDDATPRWNLFNIPGSFEENEIRFSESPLPAVMALLGIRSKGRPFAHTHMGKILQGQALTEKDFQGSSRSMAGENATRNQQRAPYDLPSEAIQSSSSSTECSRSDGNSRSSILPSSTGKWRLDTAELDGTDPETEPPRKRARAQ